MFHVAISALLFFMLCFPFSAGGQTLTVDTVWSGEVVLEDDVLVPDGRTLTILPGTTINIAPSDRTKTDPEYISSLTEIMVRGRLEVKGEFGASVQFQAEGGAGVDRWAGIIIDGGAADMNRCTIRNAETGIYVVSGIVKIKDTIISKNHYGLIAMNEQSVVHMEGTRITQNEFGVFEAGNPETTYDSSIIVQNRKKDVYRYGDYGGNAAEKYPGSTVYTRSSTPCPGPDSGLMKNYTVRNRESANKYENEVLLTDTVWKGVIEISGLVRVPEKVRLIILPGTMVEFTRRDTNGDGIGENGLLMQGTLIAKGTEESPIVFRSAERSRRMGDWDAINIMNSDGVQNLVEYVQIEDAYRGLHFHFSNVMVNGSVLRNNYRAIQFQESAVVMRGNYIFNNKSGIKARDSEVAFRNNYVFNNFNGVNFFRTGLTAGHNQIMNNINDGLRIREGMTTVEENLLDCNRFGLMINDSYFGKFVRNVISNNFETGVSVRDSNNVDLGGNFIQASGLNGINVLASGALIKGNHISENGERGIGIQSFAGEITENSIAGNGLYAIENESGSAISAPLNWFGGHDVNAALYDQDDESDRGKIDYAPLQKTPLPYHWPLKDLRADITWRDAVHVQDSLTVHSGAALKISPGTGIVLSKGAGIEITGGRIIAAGEKDKRITFTSLEQGEDNHWGEIFLDHAEGSIFSYCDFEGAAWAVHSHFTGLKILNSRFRNNDGGIRFRSGPVEIAGSEFSGNRIGMRAYIANALIHGNDIFNNETGIFVREKGGGLTIRNNNFYANSGYSIRVGDFDVEDVDAAENWWGGGDPSETIFDGRREPGVGKVLYEPFLRERVRTANKK